MPGKIMAASIGAERSNNVRRHTSIIANRWKRQKHPLGSHKYQHLVNHVRRKTTIIASLCDVATRTSCENINWIRPLTMKIS